MVAGPRGPAPSTPRRLAAQVGQGKAGEVTLVGWATVDGQPAIHLRERMAHGQVNLWVDPDSDLPIREIDTAPGVSPTSDQADPGRLPVAAVHEGEPAPCSPRPGRSRRATQAG